MTRACEAGIRHKAGSPTRVSGCIKGMGCERPFRGLRRRAEASSVPVTLAVPSPPAPPPPPSPAPPPVRRPLPAPLHHLLQQEPPNTGKYTLHLHQALPSYHRRQKHIN
mgnify:CR=1 FL=1